MSFFVDIRVNGAIDVVIALDSGVRIYGRVLVAVTIETPGGSIVTLTCLGLWVVSNTSLFVGTRDAILRHLSLAHCLFTLSEFELTTFPLLFNLDVMRRSICSV